METVVSALALQHAEFERLVASTGDDGWARPVPACPGWDVGDVVLHLAQTDELVVARGPHGDAVLSLVRTWA